MTVTTDFGISREKQLSYGDPRSGIDVVQDPHVRIFLFVQIEKGRGVLRVQVRRESAYDDAPVWLESSSSGNVTSTYDTPRKAFCTILILAEPFMTPARTRSCWSEGSAGNHTISQRS